MTGAKGGRKLIDPTALADATVRLEGRLPVAECERIVGEHGPQDGAATYLLAFDRDEEGLRRVIGSISAQVRVSCNRCLAPVELTLRPQVALGIVADERAAADLPDCYEPLPGTGAIPLSQLLEDELLLALPLVPAHPDGECNGRGDAAATGRGSATLGPFAILARLRGDGGQDD